MRRQEGHDGFRTRACAATSRATAVTAAIVVSIGVTASAQTYQATLRGQVRDQQGLVPGTQLTLINDSTNATRTAVSNEIGEYAFANLLPGLYTISAFRAGFQLNERKGIHIGTDSSLVVDFELQVSAVTVQIVVTATSSQTERGNPALSTALTAAQIAALPIFGRNTFYSAISTPNVIQTGDPQFVRYQDQTNASSLSIGGGPRRGSAYVLEGISITDFLNRPSWFPSTEAIDDMRVETRTYDAEVGRAVGGVFNVTARSGTNQWRGSGQLLTKPRWSTGQLFFAKRAGVANPPQHYYNWAGSVGGPVISNRTFFWFSTDDYVQRSTRNNVLTLPTALEREGDFSQSFNGQGQLIRIYDPLTTRTDPDRPGQFVRDQFPGNRIPTSRINPIARAMLTYVPVPTSGRAFNAQATLDDGPQNQETLKLDHRWSGSWTTTTLYGHQGTIEPGSAFWGPHGQAPGDPGGSLLRRSIHFAGVNNLFVLNDATVAAVRYGYNRFRDDASNYPEFDAGALGFPRSYVSALTFNTFPLITINGYNGFGNAGPEVATHIAHTASLSVSRFVRNHSTKFGVDYRRIGARTISYGASAGAFTFDEGFTQGPTPNSASPDTGDAIASLLLGYPASGIVNVATPGNYYIDYYSGYVQDDLRLGADLTLNVGLRYEYEPGLAEQANRLTVGFDRDAPFPIQVPGLELKGGLQYAGVDGHPRHQGASLSGASPRAGFTWLLNDRLVVRGGYAWLWVPTLVPGLGEAAIGSRGYSAATTFLASNDGGLTPAGSISNPFEGGIALPQGNTRGLATGAGSSIDFVDQQSKRGDVQHYSFDVQQDIGAATVMSVSYIGSRSARLSIGGTVDATVNINQLDPQYFALGTALQLAVANPFFGNAAFGNLARSPTISQGQLLRPFPQFDNVMAHRVDEARSRYNALVVRWIKRMTRGYALDANYTFSRLDDNQFGEGNSFSGRLGSAINNYDLDAEYGVSLLDVAHRLNFSATFELPSGAGRGFLGASRVVDALLSGWSVTVAGRYQTGFPLSIWQSSNNSGLLGSTQRPNLVPGVEAMTRGGQEERAVSGWIDPAAFTPASAFTFGHVPRTNTEWRGPSQRTTDLAVQRVVRTRGKTIGIRADVLNLFDDPLFSGPITAFGAANFGRITAVGGFARSMQFRAWLTF